MLLENSDTHLSLCFHTTTAVVSRYNWEYGALRTKSILVWLFLKKKLAAPYLKCYLFHFEKTNFNQSTLKCTYILMSNQPYCIWRIHNISRKPKRSLQHEKSQGQICLENESFPNLSLLTRRVLFLRFSN